MLKSSGIGNVGADPELKTFGNGNRVAKFNVAFNRSFKKGDEWQNETTWMSCQFWNNKADRVMASVTKGTQIFVEGVIGQNEWTTQSGEKRQAYQMNVDRFAVCVRPEKNESGNGGGQQKVTKPQEQTVPDDGGDDTPF